MASKKKEKKTETGETDADFLKRFEKIRQDSSKKASEEMKAYSKETEEFREKGRQIGKDFEEIEECKKIVEEFKANPPIMEAVEINGVSFGSSCKDSNALKKIEILKKHNFGFITATKRISTIPVNFQSFGNAYVRRGMQKIILPETSKPPTTGGFGMGSMALDLKNAGFILKDQDVLGTEKGGYIFEVIDSEQNADSCINDIFLFPESELKIFIRTNTTHPEPEFMVPEKVPEAIKRLSSNTVNTDKIMKIELIKGLFQLRFYRKGIDVNNLIELPAGYPRIEFKAATETGIRILQETVEKAGKGNKKMAEILGAAYSSAIAGERAKSGGRCEDLATFIELNRDGSLVLFGTPHIVLHKNIGKETKKIDPRKKITMTRNALFETDCAKNPDPRVEAAMNIPMALRLFVSFAASKKELEKNLSKGFDQEDDKKAYESDLEMLKNAEEMGEEKIIEMMKEKIKLDETRFRTGAGKREAVEQENAARKTLVEFGKTAEPNKRLIESSLPQYLSPSESDKV